MEVKNGLKKTLACLLVVILLLTGAPFAGVADLDFLVTAQAEAAGKLTYSVENGKATITGHSGAISGSLSIPSTLGGYPVTSIGYYAFYGCTGLTSVTIPDSVTSISYYAFYGCTGLTSVTIGNSVTSIGEYSFRDCTGLTSVTIGNSVTSIGDAAFYGCNCLTSITIPDSVESIGSNAFDDTSWYNAQPYGDIYAGKVYYKYKGTMPKNTSIAINDGTKVIASAAFAGRTGLTSITIPNSVTSIDNQAFYGCSSLTSITIPDSVTSIGHWAFHGCSGLINIAVNSGNEVYHSESNCIIETKSKELIAGCKTSIIPSDGSVTSIGESAFDDCTGLTSVTIPDSVTSIGDSAFKYCTGLTSVTIGNSVTSIGDDAFYGCTGLTSITIPDSVTSIGDYAFDDCKNLTSVTIGDSITSIGDSAFSGCKSLTSIAIPNSVTSIGYWAFSGCIGLTSLSVDSANKIYHSENNCIIETEKKNLVLGCKNSIIPSDGSVTSIGDSAFYGCKGLTSIIIPDSVTSVDGFSGCTGLTSVTIPDSVTSVDGFSGCTGLTSVTIPDSVTRIGNSAFSSCKGLTSVTIGNSVTNIGEYAFTRCTGLTSITIGNSVTSVGYEAFSDCTGLTSITIPESVTSIGGYAFGFYNDEDFVTEKVSNFTIYGHTGTTAETYANENGFTFIPLEENEVKDVATGISISYTNDVYDNDIQLNVSVVNAGSAFNVLNTEKGNFKKSLFDITTTEDGEKVQPNGSVFVKIPIPEGYNAEKTVVYYVTNDGKLEKIESEVKDGYIIFETTHFSFYAIVDESLTVNPSQNCSCACHKKGIVNFFFKIGLFFQKIFKKNKICKCGAWHY